MNIVVSGYGKMGTKVVEETEQHPTITLQNIVDYQGKKGVLHFNDLLEIPDVIIDFSHPSVLPDLLDYALKNHVKLVLATTNYSVEDMDHIKQASAIIPILQTSNTSYGIHVLLKVVEQLNTLLPQADIEIVEHHHNRKVDAPSGTAHMIVDAIKQDDTVIEHGRMGSSKRKPNEIGIHSLRGGTVSGYHEVQFFLNHEVLTISHRAENPSVFAEGALQCATFIFHQSPGYYTMNDVVKEQ